MWEDDIPNRCMNLPAGGLWVLSDRLWNCPGELKIRPGSRNGSFESRRPLVQPLDNPPESPVQENLFTPTQRKDTPKRSDTVTSHMSHTPTPEPVRRHSSSLLDLDEARDFKTPNSTDTAQGAAGLEISPEASPTSPGGEMAR